MPGAPDEPFDPFTGATVSLPSPPRADPSVPSYPDEMPPSPVYNTLITERIAIADTDPNLRRTFIRRLVIGVILLVSEVEPSAPELPPEDQIRVYPTLRRTFPELSDEEMKMSRCSLNLTYQILML